MSARRNRCRSSARQTRAGARIAFRPNWSLDENAAAAKPKGRKQRTDEDGLRLGGYFYAVALVESREEERPQKAETFWQSVLKNVVDGFALAGLSIYAHAPYLLDDLSREDTAYRPREIYVPPKKPVAQQAPEPQQRRRLPIWPTLLMVVRDRLSTPFRSRRRDA